MFVKEDTSALKMNNTFQLNRIVDEFDYYLFDFACLCEKAKLVKLVLLYFNDFPSSPFTLNTSFF